MKTISITGASGFVGCNLIAYLQNKHRCLPLTRLDIENVLPTTFENTDVIVHLAGKAHDLKKVSRPNAYYEVNFELTKKLYDAYLVSDATVFIFISSVKAAADEVAGILTESDIPDPKTDYGRSKLMAEQYIQSQPLLPGKTYYILRPCMIHGQGNKGNLNLLYSVVKKNIPYPLIAFHNNRSFLSIENLCFVIKQLIERNDIAPGIYQVADNEAISTTELIKLISTTIGKKPNLWAIPAILIYTAAKIGDVLKLPFNTERFQKLTENYVVSNRKIVYALGQNLPVDMREGIVKTIRSFDKI